MKTIKKTLALILTLAMFILSMPATVSAMEENVRILKIKVHSLLGSDLIEAETLHGATQNEWIMYLTDSLKEEFRRRMVEVFPDIPDVDEWYIDYIVLPSYYVVLQWDDRGLRPNDTVTSAEAARAIATAFEGEMEPEDGEKWYEPYYNAIEQAFPYNRAEVNEEYMARPITRAETAYVLAKILDDGSLDSYTSDIANSETTGIFEEFANIAKVADADLDAESKYMDEGILPMRFAGAIAYLYDKGIMTGDEQGHMNPLAPVTRAELLTLIYKACQACEGELQV